MTITSCFGCRSTGDKIGVLLAQLGTPDAPTASALRPYLKQFLSDPRVIEVNRLLWWFILNGIILVTRPKRSAELYKRIWTEKGSPLLVTTMSQAKKTQELFKSEGIEIEFEIGMRYGNPSLDSALDRLVDRGCSRILLFPLYPQYAAATTASTYDVVFRNLASRRSVPTLKTIEPFYNHCSYIEALKTVASDFLQKNSWRPDKILLSYHGVPRRYVDNGDPYCCHCVETTEHLRKSLNFPGENILHSYQSKFGKEPWLNPYTDETIAALAKSGVKKLAVMCPGFVTDCLETIDEIGHEARELFIEAGGEELALIPCLNEHPSWIRAMADIIRPEITPWLDSKRLQPHCSPCPVNRARCD